MTRGHEVGFAEITWATDDAILFDVANHGPEWIPKSQIHDDSEVWKAGQRPGTLVVTQWFAEGKGWL